MNLIEEDSPRWHQPAGGHEFIEYSESERISDLLVGHKVTKVADDHLQLDDGTLLKFVGTNDCCACYSLAELNGVDNIITSVEMENDPYGDDYPDGGGKYKIFVYADNVKVNLATFEGGDGTGYYGTGYTIVVRKPEVQS